MFHVRLVLTSVVSVAVLGALLLPGLEAMRGGTRPANAKRCDMDASNMALRAKTRFAVIGVGSRRATTVVRSQMRL